MASPSSHMPPQQGICVCVCVGDHCVWGWSLLADRGESPLLQRKSRRKGQAIQEGKVRRESLLVAQRLELYVHPGQMAQLYPDFLSCPVSSSQSPCLGHTVERARRKNEQALEILDASHSSAQLDCR